MICEHDLADKEGACADGMCPICIASEVEQLRYELGQAVAAERERCITILRWFATDKGRLYRNDIEPIVAAIRKRDE